MRIIPVIDLKGGHVVRAFRGERASYAPIVTPLAASSTPEAVVAGFLRLYDFDTLYVADLDAIERCGGHAQTICALALAFPQVSFWVDDGGAALQCEPEGSWSDAAPDREPSGSPISRPSSAARVSRRIARPICRMRRAPFSRSIFAATPFSGPAICWTIRDSGRPASSS